MQTAGARKRHAHFKEDSSVTACEACAKTFSAFRRRHHCRACGGIFCNACSTKRCDVAGQRDGLRRVCDDCFDQLKPSAVPAAAAQDVKRNAENVFGKDGEDLVKASQGLVKRNSKVGS